MLLSELRKRYLKLLAELYPKSEVNSIFNICVEHLLGLDNLSMHLDPGRQIASPEQEKMFSALARLTEGEPVQYILGKTSFYDLELLVKPGVLIPRQETELMVDMIVREFSNHVPRSIIDLCTGSGCIAIALKKQFPLSEVTATDIADVAIELAKQNSQLNNAPVNILRQNLFECPPDWPVYDLIVSNPPYVRNSEKSMMHKNVLEYEPELALFVDDTDPLVYYQAIIEFAQKNLSHEGVLFLEINEYLGSETKKLFEQNGFNHTQIFQDLENKDRILRCQKSRT